MQNKHRGDATVAPEDVCIAGFLVSKKPCYGFSVGSLLKGKGNEARTLDRRSTPGASWMKKMATSKQVLSEEG